MVRATLRGDAEATDRLVDRLGCVPRIVASINRRFGAPLSYTELADVSQEVIILVWQRRSDYEGRAKLETWVYRICYLEFLNESRRSQRRPLFVGDGLDVRDPSTSSRTRPEVDFEALDVLLSELGTAEEQVIRLKHFEGLTFTEIAERSGRPSSSVKSRYYRGIARLRFRIDSQRWKSGS